MSGQKLTESKAERAAGTALADHLAYRLNLNGFVVAGLFSRDGERALLALGNGISYILANVSRPEPRPLRVHAGTPLSLCRDIDPAGFLSSGDDGRFVRITGAGDVEEIASFPGCWVDHVAANPESCLRACSVGKSVHVYDRDGMRRETFDHPSTVGGLAFDSAGKRIAVAHYGGVTVWRRGRNGWVPKRLNWRGMHIKVVWNPDDRFLITSMQENALHGWRLRDRMDMRMTGYPRKVRSLEWSHDGQYLITNGASQAVCWPFGGADDGPMGKVPLEVASGGRQMSTVVAAHPSYPFAAVGFQDGLVLLTSLERDPLVVPVKTRGQSAVTTLAFSPCGTRLLIADEVGGTAWLTMPET